MTLDEQVTCIRREIAMRRNVYPRWVATDRMSKDRADHEMACMQAVLITLTVNYPAALERIKELEQKA